MEAKVFKTPCQTEREARDLAIYNEYNSLMTVEGQSKTVVTEHLMKKYGIHSQGTIYLIRRRVEERLKSKEVRKMTLWDAHMHSSFSGDAHTPPEEMADTAMEKHLPGITFTDHLDWDYLETPGLFDLNIEEYLLNQETN